MMPMRPPGSTPAAMKPLATASTSAANSRQLIGDHWPPAPLRENAAANGDSLALRTGRSARLPSVVTGASGATTLSFTVTPDGGGELCCTLPMGNRADHVTMITGRALGRARHPGAGLPSLPILARLRCAVTAAGHAASTSGRRDSLRRMADRTESSIVIDAPPGEVLDVIAD